MSGSQHPFVSSSKRFGKAVEKSNFAHTCNLLSQYVKARGHSLRDLNLAGIGGKSEAITAKPEECKATTTTLNLLNNIENLAQPSSQQWNFVDPLSRFAPPLVTSGTLDDATRKASSSKEEIAVEPKRAPMTIFHAGEVIVFNDFPAERAKEIMLLASSKGSNGGFANGNASSDWKTTSNNVEKLCPVDAVASSSKAAADPVPAAAAQELPKQPQLEANTGSELPIARRSSLHRFLAKRKDRAGARAPYQLHNNNNNDHDGPESSSKNDQEQLELKL